MARPQEADRERIVELLETNGGRVWQKEIVNATEWSKAKVSMTVSEMAANGTIHKLRMGRENLVTLEPLPLCS